MRLQHTIGYRHVDPSRQRAVLVLHFAIERWGLQPVRWPCQIVTHSLSFFERGPKCYKMPMSFVQVLDKGLDGEITHTRRNPPHAPTPAPPNPVPNQPFQQLRYPLPFISLQVTDVSLIIQNSLQSFILIRFYFQKSGCSLLHTPLPHPSPSPAPLAYN
jgi:hypothetical protein